MAQEVKLSSYTYRSGEIPVRVEIFFRKGDFVPTYWIDIPGVGESTKVLLQTKLRSELLAEVDLDIMEILDPKRSEFVRKRFIEGAKKILKRSFSNLDEKKLNILTYYLVHHTIGLGELEILLADDRLEEIVINSDKEPVWVYHKKHGWCRTNVKVRSDEYTYNFASLIARKVGRQINVLNPLLDAHLPSGDRVNATLFPISAFGNTLTIRKFSKNPWTVTTLMREGTVSAEVLAVIWLAVQNELSLLISGGTGSGKTSFLNAISSFIPPNQRIISIEDTRELTLPKYLHWVPLVTREPNPEGKGGVTMLDLLVNSLRMRPDRIIVGEVRRQREAEILFEAIHTGHSVYATIHADNSEQTVSRLTNPPINVHKEMLDALAGIVVQFRHRRFGIRRTLELSEVLKDGKINVVYRWHPRKDVIEQVGEFSKIVDLIQLYSGMTEREMEEDIQGKVDVLNWMYEKGYFDVDEVGHIISNYYLDPDYVVEVARAGKNWKFE